MEIFNRPALYIGIFRCEEGPSTINPELHRSEFILSEFVLASVLDYISSYEKSRNLDWFLSTLQTSQEEIKSTDKHSPRQRSPYTSIRLQCYFTVGRNMIFQISEKFRSYKRQYNDYLNVTLLYLLYAFILFLLLSKL